MRLARMPFGRFPRAAGRAGGQRALKDVLEFGAGITMADLLMQWKRQRLCW